VGNPVRQTHPSSDGYFGHRAWGTDCVGNNLSGEDGEASPPAARTFAVAFL